MLSCRNNSNKQLLHCICLEYLFDLSQKCFTTYSLCDKLHFSLSLSPFFQYRQSLHWPSHIMRPNPSSRTATHRKMQWNYSRLFASVSKSESNQANYIPSNPPISFSPRSANGHQLHVGEGVDEGAGCVYGGKTAGSGDDNTCRSLLYGDRQTGELL